MKNKPSSYYNCNLLVPVTVSSHMNNFLLPQMPNRYLATYLPLILDSIIQWISLLPNGIILNSCHSPQLAKLPSRYTFKLRWSWLVAYWFIHTYYTVLSR
jgi:hypothetical protein